MIFKRRNPIVPFALECALLFVAVSVFGWGLQAKLSLYHNNKKHESTSTGYMAKLSTEKSSASTVTSVDDNDQRRLMGESRYASAIVFSLLGHDVAPAILVRPEPGPRIPGRFNLHGPDLTRRPPPVLS
jgi:hypothetical protein